MYAISDHMRDANLATSVLFNNRVYELQQQGKPVTVLSLGEAFFDLDIDGSQLTAESRWLHYSHSRGLPELRQKLAELYNTYGVRVDPDSQLLVTAGCKLACYLSLLALLNPGDEVLIQDPAWVSYPEQVRLCHGTARHVPCDEGVEDYEKYLTDKTKVIVINNPLNPSGKVYTPIELRYLARMARRNNLAILADETYSDFAPAGSFQSLGVVDPDFENVIIANSLSKCMGISGWRLGYVIGGSFLIEQILKGNQHIVTCPATPLAAYVARNFDHLRAQSFPQIQRATRMRERAAGFLQQLGRQALSGESTYYLFVSIAPSQLGSWDFCDQLLDRFGIAVVPGIGYGPSCDNYVRVSVGTESWQSISTALRTIDKFASETSTKAHAA